VWSDDSWKFMSASYHPLHMAWSLVHQPAG
jgi:hypothetical protein